MRADLAGLLASADEAILPRELSERASPLDLVPPTLSVGADLGTAYLVLVVLDGNGRPLAGEWQFAEVVRDGLVVDFVGATDLLRGMRVRLERRLGRELTSAASAYPPGVPQAEVRAVANVVEAAGMRCSGLVDEPSAANLVLQLQDGVIVDVGGGTTGIAVVQNGRVIYTADEPTGGTHFSLVVAGSQNLSFAEAEALKVRPEEQARLFPSLRPVMEKVASIILHHVEGRNVPSIVLVGGASAFPGMAEVILAAMRRDGEFRSAMGVRCDEEILGAGRELGFVIADVSGKGIPAALFMAVSRTLLKTMALKQQPPAECLFTVNHMLCGDNASEMFVTLFYGILDVETGELEFCNGGHNYPYILRAGGGAEMLRTRGPLAPGTLSPGHL